MTVHLAGNTVTIGRRIIQRCLVCGYKLNDIDLDRVAVAQFSTDKNRPSTVIDGFAVGHLIEVQEGNPTHYADVGDSKEPSFDAAWKDCCIHLVEEA